ncbi:putative CAP [Hibiscus syriacus]|uniref:CAP n=1 Tax=Hibiscus syriacus TaxID=106335 RepID=A0A6A2WH14_HIBSY|nr:putative CAP [Hibiscus syriacus]
MLRSTVKNVQLFPAVRFLFFRGIFPTLCSGNPGHGFNMLILVPRSYHVYLTAHLPSNATPQNINDQDDDDDDGKAMRVFIIILITLLVLTVTIIALVVAHKHWQKKKRQQEQARFLKLFEEGDDIEDELGLGTTWMVFTFTAYCCIHSSPPPTQKKKKQTREVPEDAITKYGLVDVVAAGGSSLFLSIIAVRLSISLFTILMVTPRVIIAIRFEFGQTDYGIGIRTSKNINHFKFWSKEVNGQSGRVGRPGRVGSDRSNRFKIGQTGFQPLTLPAAAREASSGELDFNSAEYLTAPPPHAPPSTETKVEDEQDGGFNLTAGGRTGRWNQTLK